MNTTFSFKYEDDYLYIKKLTFADVLEDNGVDLQKPIQVNPFGEWLDCTIGIVKDDRIGIYIGYDHHWITSPKMVRNKRREITRTIATFLCDDGQVRTAVDNGIFKKERYLKENGIGYEKLEVKKTWEVSQTK